MQTPLQITFRATTHSDALAIHLKRRAERLEHIFDRIVSCHVVVELAGHHHRHGDRYHVSIRLGLPGHELLVTHCAPEDRDDGSAYTTADAAFDDAGRQLEEWVRRQREMRRAAGAFD